MPLDQLHLARPGVGIGPSAASDSSASLPSPRPESSACPAESLRPPAPPVAARRLIVKSRRPPPSTYRVPPAPANRNSVLPRDLQPSPPRHSVLPPPARLPPLLQPEEGLGAEPAPCGGRQPVCVSLAPTQRAPTRPHTVCTCVCTWQKHSGIEGTESSGSNCGSVTDGLCGLGQVT